MSNGFLSQEEIDSLLNGGGSSEDSTVKEAKEEKLTALDIDLLGEIGNISMGSASTALSQIINQQVNITTPVVSLTTLNQIKDEFQTPTVILDVEYVSGIIGRNILIIKTDDAGVIANLMMGGDGTTSSHDLSELEISAVSEAMNQMIGSAATSMATMFGREVNISPPSSKVWREKSEILTDKIAEDEEVVKVSFRMTIGNLVDSSIMQLLPINTAKKIVSIMTGTEEIEQSATPVVDETPQIQHEIEVPINREVHNEIAQVIPQEVPRMGSQPKTPVEVSSASFETLGQKSVVTGENTNIDLILDVPLQISVVLGRTQKAIKDVLSLGTGSLIELDKLAEEPVEILVNGKKIALGEVVVVDENFGVRITSIIPNAERIRSLK